MNNGIKNIAAISVSLLMAVILGQWVVTDPKLAGIAIAIFAAGSLFFILNKNVWILIPAFMTLGISFPWIPGDFSPIQLASMYVSVCTFLLLASHKVTLRLRMTSIEWMAVLMLLMLLQAYMRNPVGIRLLGSENVGGRPYVIMLIALAGGVILATTRTDHAQIKKAFKWSVIGYMATFSIQLAASVSATIAGYTAILFGAGGGHASATDELRDSTKAGRNGAAAVLAKASSRCLVAFRHPLKAMCHPFWGLIVLSALLGAGMSGFRNVIASTLLTLVLGTYYWGRGQAVIRGCFIGVSGYLIINIINIAVPLPPNVQRSLSFLPGTWEERYIIDAEGSTNWRVEMWEEALTTDRYIENKIIGDGLGIRRSDFMFMQEISDSRVITNEMSQERAMLAGDFHSGPVSSVRVVGYVGLLVLIVTMIVVAVRAHKLIMYSRGKPYFREVIFFCLPMVWGPIFFLFIYGDYKGMVPGLLVQMGLLRLFEINLKGRIDEAVIES